MPQRRCQFAVKLSDLRVERGNAHFHTVADGGNHDGLLEQRMELAAHLLAQLQEAIALHEATVADCARVLGADHPATLHARHNLAHASQVAGELAQPWKKASPVLQVAQVLPNLDEDFLGHFFAARYFPNDC